MNAFNLVAHAGEDHGGAESINHLLESTGFAFFIWALIALTAYVVSKFVLKLNMQNISLILAVIHLGLGIYLYDKSGAIAAIIVSVGFVLTLVTVMTGLGGPAKESEDE